MLAPVVRCFTEATECSEAPKQGREVDFGSSRQLLFCQDQDGQGWPTQLQAEFGQIAAQSRLPLKIEVTLWLVFIESRRGRKKELDLGNLNPIYERELNVLNKLDVRQAKGRWNVSRDGEGGKGCRHEYPVKDEMHKATVEGEEGARGYRQRAPTQRCAYPP